MKTFLPFGILASALAVTLGLSWATAEDPPKKDQPDPQKLLPAPKAEPEADGNKNFLEMQQNLEKALRSGDPQQLTDAIQQMRKLLEQDLQRNGLPNMQFLPMQGDPVPMFQFGGGFGGFGQNAPLVEDNPAEELRKTMDETVKNFDKSIDEAQDEETKKSLRAARDNYKKTTEDEIAKLIKEQPARPAQRQMQPFNFAPVPMNGADPFGLFAPNLMQKPRLGVSLLEVPEGMAGQLKLKENEGVMVNRVLPDSVAEKVGLERFDIILEFAGKPLTSNVQKFIEMVQDAKAGDALDIVVLRNGERKTLKGVVLAKAEPQADNPLAGPMLFRMNMFDPFPLADLPGDGKKMSQMRMSVTNDGFTIDTTENNVEYAIKGTIADGAKTVTAIKITQGNKTIEAETLEKVPAEYRKNVEQLLERVKISTSPAKKRI